ncbi:MAG: tRNA 4-thiouridine(8) synthase ThiI [Oscillospiraceae bacterium]|nr:tRNA 4-thiouridine(8) synthase ThiI [Oscillospiraceae bacterium]
MKEIILIKNGELALKGLNRSTFEDILIKNIRRRLKPLGEFEYRKEQSTVTVVPLSDGVDMDEVSDRVGRVFGIACYSRALQTEKNMEAILENAPIYLAEQLKNAKTFKVEGKRSDKKFPLTSPELSAQVGGAILEKFPHLKVDVKNPEVLVTVEIREKFAFIRGNQTKGAGGMPSGTAGRATILISGGIDSPVAAYMMAKRGLSLTAVHFASPPYTSPQSEMKVHDLLRQVSKYSGNITLFTVGFTEIQEQIRDNCPEDIFTLVMRRFMMRIAEKIAEREDCKALITGESLGQVASQTLLALSCTDAAVSMPVFRPLIGMDKDEIIKISRKIDTFDISIEPYEDCCTVFTPKHPKTKPQLSVLLAAEEALDADALIERAIENTKLTNICF